MKFRQYKVEDFKKEKKKKDQNTQQFEEVNMKFDEGERNERRQENVKAKEKEKILTRHS